VISQAYDRVIVGNSQPKFIFGLTNNLSYGLFDLNFLLQGSYGNKIYNGLSASLNQGTGYNNGGVRLLDRWRPGHEDTDVQRALEDPAVLPSDTYIEDGSYLRLKNLTLGVTLPEKLLRSIKIKKVRLYVSAQNILTWTKYSGYDPEANTSGQSTLTQGSDYGAYPVNKSFLGGLNITF
jgi:hypothetical protein